jgi:hypothetical protein
VATTSRPSLSLTRTREVLTESLALSIVAALLGLAFAYWGSHLLLMTQGNSLQVTLDLTPDLRVLSRIISVAIVTGILFGLAPAWRCSREDPGPARRVGCPGFARHVNTIWLNLFPPYLQTRTR